MSDLIRRLFEIVFSLSIIAICFIPGLILALFVHISGPGGVLYKSRRYGREEKPFYLYKFRSMVSYADQMGAFNVGDSDCRVTRIGRFLRTTKLDELPQFFNVLVGQIALVGPRPDIEYYVKMYSDEEKRTVFAIKPGITDWASLVNYEQYNDFSLSDDPDEYFVKFIRPLKVRLQIYYCEHRSLFSDLWIIILTAFKMIKIQLPLPKDVRQVVNEYNKRIYDI